MNAFGTKDNAKLNRPKLSFVPIWDEDYIFYDIKIMPNPSCPRSFDSHILREFDDGEGFEWMEWDC